MKLERLSDDELLSGVKLLLGSQRRLTALLLSYLAEVEERRLHLLAACSSMFDFCTARRGIANGGRQRCNRSRSCKEATLVSLT